MKFLSSQKAKQGYEMLLSGEYKKALILAEEAININVKNYIAYLIRGSSLYEEGKYTEDGIRYFIQPDACSGHSLVKIKIRNYLQIQEYGKYEAFKWNWFHFLKDAEAAVVSDTDVSSGTKLGFFVLETFFLRPYDGGDFYSTVDKRIKRARHYLGL